MAELSPEEDSSGDASSSPAAESPSDRSDEPTSSPFFEKAREQRNRADRLQKQFFYALFLAGISVVALVVAIIINLQLSQSTRVEPFYVAVNEETGEVVQSGSVSRMQTLSAPLIKSRIELTIRGLRVVYSDQRATEKSYRRAYSHVLPGSDADAFLRTYYDLTARDEENISSPPFLVGEVQRTVTDLEVTPIEGTKTYEVRWIERELNPQNDNLVERAFTGSVSTVRIDETTTEALEQNPLGLYLDGLSFQESSKELIQSDS